MCRLAVRRKNSQPHGSNACGSVDLPEALSLRCNAWQAVTTSYPTPTVVIVIKSNVLVIFCEGDKILNFANFNVHMPISFNTVLGLHRCFICCTYISELSILLIEDGIGGSEKFSEGSLAIKLYMT